MFYIDEIRAFCLSLPKTSESFPFDNVTLVFKVQDKMFALVNINQATFINLKCDPEYAVELREQFHGIQPGYHMSKIHWNSVALNEDVSREKIEALILHSYQEVIKKLPKAKRDECQI